MPEKNTAVWLSLLDALNTHGLAARPGCNPDHGWV